MIARIPLNPDTFLVAEEDGTILGYINGPVISQSYITDDLFEKDRQEPSKWRISECFGHCCIQTGPGQGDARILMKALETLFVEKDRTGITLTCKQDLIAFYEILGFENHGVSESEHGGVNGSTGLNKKDMVSDCLVENFNG